MKSISLKMSKNFKIEPLCKNNVYELENNSAMVDIECEVDSTLTYKMHISHGGTKSFVVMTKNESSISTMLTAPILNSNGVYYIQIEGIKTDYRIVSNQIRFEAGSFINAESIPTPSQQGVIDQILIRLDTAEGDIDDLEEDVATLTTSVGAKADKSYVDANLALKQDKSAMNQYVKTVDFNPVKTASICLQNFPYTVARMYNSEQNYHIGDYCCYKVGSEYWYSYYIYKCIQDCRGIEPDSSLDYWERVVACDELKLKQDKLTAGSGIDITNNVISATGGGGGGDVTKAYVDEQDEAIRNSIPTDVSDLNNDSGYLTPNTVGQYVPTKTSQLTNDSDFTTTEQVATQLDTKQNVLTAGTNITIVDDVISSTASGGSTVTMSDNANAGVDLTVDGTSRTLAKSSELATVNDALLELTTSKQDKLIAGSGIVISSDGKTISSTGGGSGTCVVVDNADGGVDVSDGTTTRTLATQNGLDEVNDISTALINGENVVSSDLWTGEFLNGYYNADGVFVETNNYKDCTPVDISRYNQLSISVTPTINFPVIIGFFDSEDNITVTQLESVTSGTPYNKTIDIPSNAEKFVVNSRRTSNATYDSWSIIGIIKNPMTDFTSNMELLDGRITSNTTSINTIKSDVYTTTEDYSNIDLSFDNIGWYGSNGVYYSSSDYRYAEVECSAGEKYDVTGRTNWTISPYIVLDSNNSMLYSGSSSGSGSTVTKSERLTIPSGGVKICFSAPKNDTTWKNTCKCVKVINNEKSIVGTTYNALKGVKWGAIGDSFTDTITLSTQTDKRNYVDLIKEQTGVTVVNLGVSGTGYKRTEESNTAFYQRASNVDNDFDVITIFGSGNDQQYSSQAQVGNATDTGTDTLAGCVNTTIDNLLARNPVVRIGIVAPTPWAGYAPFNTNATWMKRYSQMLSDVCTLRGIPFLDLYHESNLRPWDSACMQALYKDDTHPNTEGHKRIASKIKAFLIEIVG